MAKTLVLLSGGLDSATVLALALSSGVEVGALSFEYGQGHLHELKMARLICAEYEVAHEVFAIPDLFSGSSLLADGSVPKNRSLDEINACIPTTFVAGRNLVFLSIAASYAYSRGFKRLAVGFNRDDRSGYPDCRPDFLSAFSDCLNKSLPSGNGLEVWSPLVDLTKEQIVQTALDLQVPLSLTSSCYAPLKGKSCRSCDACVLRANAFKKIGAEDLAI